MTHALSRRWFWLIGALFGVWLRSRNHHAGKGVVEEYQARLGIVKANTISDSLIKLRLLYRSPQGKPWPDEVKERLDSLEGAIIEIALSRDEQQDYTRTQNALIEWQNAYDTFERRGLLVPILLDQIQVDLVQARNALDPNQGRPR